jgi:hypothetical protein
MFDTAAFLAIQQLEFEDFTESKCAPHYMLIFACPNLTAHKLRFSTSALMQSPTMESIFISRIAHTHQLHKVVDIPRLETLNFRFPDMKACNLKIRPSLGLRYWFLMRWNNVERNVKVNCGFEDSKADEELWSEDADRTHVCTFD